MTTARFLDELLPESLSAEKRSVHARNLDRIVAGEMLVKEAMDWYWLRESRGHYRKFGMVIRLLMLPECHPAVRGAVLRAGLLRGAGPGAFAVFPRREVLSWLSLCPADTLMTDSERTMLTSLPDPVEAYRGGWGTTARQAAVGLSWTLDRAKAEWFAARWGHVREPAMVVHASFPKMAVFAFFQEREESELVVNWRRARGLTIDAGGGLAVRLAKRKAKR